ncbi:hypothetical protein ACRAWD_18560 [Caulobacter segnis]
MLDETNRRSRQSQDRASLSGTNIERAGDYNQRVALQSIRGRPGQDQAGGRRLYRPDRARRHQHHQSSAG